jgi:hypothetical protein
MMSYIDSHSTSAISASRGSRCPQFQQSPWTFNNTENKAALTSPTAISEALEIQMVYLIREITSASLLAEIQLQQAERLYAFRNESEVRSTLREYSFLLQLLLDTYSKIEEHFPDSQVFVEVVIAYEAFEQYPGIEHCKELVVSIATSLPPEEAMKTLKQFYDNWWLKASKEANGKVSVGLEFL